MLLGVLLIFLSLACAFEPYAQRDPNSLAPPGESEPVPNADPNPLENPTEIFVICAPQGGPLVETRATRDCAADPECQIRCTVNAERALEDGL